MKKTPFFNLVLLTLLFLLTSSINIFSLTISPELRERLHQEGRLESFMESLHEMRDMGVGTTMPFSLKNISSQALTDNDTTRLRVVVILTEFPDNPADSGYYATVDEFEERLFSRNTVPTGSFTDFYLENSYGKFLVEGDVFGWYMLNHDYSYYTNNNGGLGSEPNARTLVRDAVQMADNDINFSLYDNDVNGFVEGLFVVHSGVGREETGLDKHIHSHSWTLPTAYLTNDGVRVLSYTIEPEESEGGGIAKIGVYCHEFGHTLGLPDLYDVSDISWGIGYWSLMSGGSWLGGGNRPAHFDGWCKHVLDSTHGTFGKTIDVTANMKNVVLGPSVTDSIRYRIMMPTPSGKEYFIIENRQRVGSDLALPGTGLLVLHCDDRFPENNNLSTYRNLHVAVEQADGLLELEQKINQGGPNDLWPGISDENIEFTSLTNPSTHSNDSLENQIAIWNIIEDHNAKTVTCNFDVTYSRSNMHLLTSAFSDDTYGNNNGIFEAGERIEFAFSVDNIWKTAGAIKAVLTEATTGIELGTYQVNLKTLVTDDTLDNYSNPFDFTIDNDFVPTTVPFELTITTAIPADTLVYNFYQAIGGAQILLVDGDGSGLGTSRLNQRNYFEQTLDSLFVPYDLWNTYESGVPGSEQLNYNIIIWFCGDYRAGLSLPSLVISEIDFLESYLNQGGNLFLTGQDIAEQLSQLSDSTFLKDYLHAEYDGWAPDNEAEGVSGNIVGDDLFMNIFAGDGAGNQSTPDRLIVLDGAEEAFTYPNKNGSAGLTVNSDYRLVYFGFAFESVGQNDPAYDSRTDVMQKIINFFSGASSTISINTDNDDHKITDIFLEQNSPNPFNPTTLIEYYIPPELSGQQVTLSIINILGQNISTLVNKSASTGKHIVNYDGSNLSSGIYFYRLTVGESILTKKMLLTK